MYRIFKLPDYVKLRIFKLRDYVKQNCENIYKKKIFIATEKFCLKNIFIATEKYFH